MRTTFGCLAILVAVQLTVPCYGQPLALHDPPAHPPSRVVNGTVINAVSGVPVRRALVQISGNSPLAGLTGPDGRFRFENVPEGQILISVQKPGFFDASSIPGAMGGQADPMVTVGSGKNDFPVSLYPGARIAGRVTDMDGEPIENISIQVLREQIVQGRKLFQPQNSVATDDDGTYRMEGLMPGRFAVFANRHLLPAPYWSAPPEVTRPVYYPDSRDLASAQQIEISAGQEFRADFRLRSERGFRVAAGVHGIPDKAGVGFWFENASGHNVAFWPINLNEKKGTLVAEAVPSGAWTLVLSATDGAGKSYQERREIVVDGADVTDLQIFLQPSTSIPVQVNHAAKPVKPSELEFADTGGLNASLISIDPLHYLGYDIRTQGSPPVSSFDNVAAGTYKFSIHPSGSSECLESAWYGSVDLTRDYLVVGSGVDAEKLTINLRRDCGTLRVKLHSEEYRRFAFLLLIPNSPMAEPETLTFAGPPPTQLADMSTQYILSPGSYQVFAFSNMDGLDYANPETMRGYSGKAVTLEPGQKADLTLEVIERKGN